MPSNNQRNNELDFTPTIGTQHLLSEERSNSDCHNMLIPKYQRASQYSTLMPDKRGKIDG